jgi:hypothetical protein
MQPSKELRNAVRAGFVNQDSSLAEYCRGRGICDSNANKALLGKKWNGKKAAELRLELVIAAKIDVSQVRNSEQEVANQSCEPVALVRNS